MNVIPSRTGQRITHPHYLDTAAVTLVLAERFNDQPDWLWIDDSFRLTKADVIDLITILQRWVDTGRL